MKQLRKVIGLGLVVCGIAAAVVFGVWLAGALYVGYLFSQFDVKQIAFQSETWKSTPAEFSRKSVRQAMVDDMLDKHDFLLDMTRMEVEELLGAADDTEYFRDFDMVYFLGPERGIGVDSEWLIIKLDASGKVVTARLATD